MNPYTSNISQDLHLLADDAKDLLAATQHLAEEKIVTARKRLSAALEKGKESWGRAQERAVHDAKVADKAIHDHPYQAVGIAFGVGAVLGYLLARRH